MATATKRQLINAMKAYKGLPPYEDRPQKDNEVFKASLQRDINYTEKYTWEIIEDLAYAEAGL